MHSGYESTGIANSGITTHRIRGQLRGMGWHTRLRRASGTEEVTGNRVIQCHFGAVTGISVDSVVFVTFLVAGEESVEIPSTGTFIERGAGGLAVNFKGQGCIGFIHSNPAESNSTMLEAGEPSSVTSNCCTACSNLAIFLMWLSNQIFWST